MADHNPNEMPQGVFSLFNFITLYTLMTQNFHAHFSSLKARALGRILIVSFRTVQTMVSDMK